jgi:hypothetical protein
MVKGMKVSMLDGVLQGQGRDADAREFAALVDHARRHRARRRVIPGNTARRNTPVRALVTEHGLGPGFADDLVMLVEQFTIDPVVLCEVRVVGGGVGRVHLLPDRHHVAGLVAARETSAHAPVRHLVEHGQVLGEQDGIARRQHVAHLADAEAAGLHGGPQAEQHRVVGNLQAFEMKVMLGERAEIETEVLDLAQQPRAIGQTALVVIGILAGEAALEVGGRGAGARQHERAQANFHDISSPRTAAARGPSMNCRSELATTRASRQAGTASGDGV